MKEVSIDLLDHMSLVGLCRWHSHGWTTGGVGGRTCGWHSHDGADTGGGGGVVAACVC